MSSQKLNPGIEVTQDGSHSLRHHKIDELYHSHYGAIQESKHVFIEAGLHQLNNLDSIDILEIGFGTGLNALLTALENSGIVIRYTGVEKYPVPESTWRQLNYADQLGGDAEMLFQSIHLADWEEMAPIKPSFQLQKINCDFHDFTANMSFDLIYYDAFAPTAQPEFWEGPILENMFNSLRPGGVLVTYCCKGSFRRGLQDAGFEVAKIPGPPGKREMVRATKPK